MCTLSVGEKYFPDINEKFNCTWWWMGPVSLHLTLFLSVLPGQPRSPHKDQLELIFCLKGRFIFISPSLLRFPHVWLAIFPSMS